MHADRWKEPLTPGATVQLAVHRLQSMGGEQMRHYPLPWEKTFCNVICPKIGWWPGSPPPKPTARNKESLATRNTESKKKSPSTQRGTSSGAAHQTEEDPFLAALLSRLADYGLQVDDLRRKGGCLWVRADTKDQSLNRMLLGAGFTHSGSNGWWKK